MRHAACSPVSAKAASAVAPIHTGARTRRMDAAVAISAASSAIPSPAA